MAHVIREHCDRCKKTTIHINGICRDCAGKDTSRKRREHFGRLNALTIEERLRRLEEIDYNDSINPFVEPTY